MFCVRILTSRGFAKTTIIGVIAETGVTSAKLLHIYTGMWLKLVPRGASAYRTIAVSHAHKVVAESTHQVRQRNPQLSAPLVPGAANYFP